MHLSLTFSRLLDANPASHLAAHHANFWASCNLLDFAELRNYFRSQPLVAHRRPPCKFFSSFFYNCILQGAIVFAEAAYPRKAWQGLHISLTFSCGHIATHHAAFSTSAICRTQLILRCWRRGANAARYSAWQALHLSLTFSRLLVRQPHLSHRNPHAAFSAMHSARCN